MTDELSFFARRRAALKAEREAEHAADQPEAAAAHDTEEPDLSDMSDADILELLDLPDPDTLRRGDDFAAFMAKAVPLHLRNRALRKLWRSDPLLACRDGLNDYDADYLTGSTGQGIIATSYKVGRGLLENLAEMRKPDEEATPPAAEDDPRDDDDAIAPPDAPSAEVAAAHVEPDDDAGAPARSPRRMRFDFGDRT